MGIYAEAAEAVRSAGLNPLPLVADAKRPAVKWKHWQDKRIPANLVSRWCGSAMGEKNIGTTTGGITGLLLVDVDSTDTSFWKECIARWGDTPAKVRTASGKLHLWYASPGGVRNAQRIDGTPVDIRADGGFAVLPPSVRDGVGGYAWLEGDLNALGRLPLPRAGSLPAPASPPPAASSGASTGASGDLAGVQRGARNNALFRHLLVAARDCQSEADLAAEALRRNADLAEPEPLNDVLRTARSVWRYKDQGTLIVPGGPPAVLVLASVIDDLAMSDPDAFALWSWLRRQHENLRPEFALSIRATAASVGWTERRLRAARGVLLERGLLVQVNQGGDHDGDAARFRLGGVQGVTRR